MAKYDKDELFGDVIIITPENADRYPDYDRAKKVIRYEVDLATITKYKFGDFGTDRVPLPILYVPTEVFNALENNLESAIVYHEGNHARVFRKGFDSKLIN